MITQRRNGQKRVVVTGVGSVNPLGVNLEDSWNQALNGRSGIGLVTRFNTEKFDVKIAGEVKNFNPDLYVDKKEQKKMDLFIQYAIAGAQMAFAQGGLKMDESNSHRV